MATKKTPQEILREKFPDMEIVESESDAKPNTAHMATRSGPSMADLRRKYRDEDTEGAADGEADAIPPPDDSRVEVKQMRSRKSPADPADDPGPRSVIISREDEEVEGAQG